jgi:hypothetical protein
MTAAIAAPSVAPNELLIKREIVTGSMSILSSIWAARSNWSSSPLRRLRTKRSHRLATRAIASASPKTRRSLLAERQ